MNSPLSIAAQHVAAHGRHGDSVLLHISPEEYRTLALMNGGHLSVNPHTGLPEAFSLGGIFKKIAPIAGAVVGGIFGGPFGAAAGGALGKAVTGGSLGDSLLAGGLSYLGAGALGGFGGAAGGGSGAGGGLFGGLFGGSGTGGGLLGGLFGQGTGPANALGGLGGDEGIDLGFAAGEAIPGASGGGGGLGSLLSNPFVAGGLGLMAGSSMGGQQQQQPVAVPKPGQDFKPGTAADYKPEFHPYQGDLTHYGEGPSEWDFVTKNQMPAVTYAAEGGRIRSNRPMLSDEDEARLVKAYRDNAVNTFNPYTMDEDGLAALVGNINAADRRLKELGAPDAPPPKPASVRMRDRSDLNPQAFPAPPMPPRKPMGGDQADVMRYADGGKVPPMPPRKPFDINTQAIRAQMPGGKFSETDAYDENIVSPGIDALLAKARTPPFRAPPEGVDEALAAFEKAYPDLYQLEAQSIWRNKLRGKPLDDPTGAYAAGGRAMGYLAGGTPGQEDQVDAKLSDGEYVLPADVVSALGQGNNKAGADKLDQFMSRTRQKAFGTKRQMRKLPESHVKKMLG